MPGKLGLFSILLLANALAGCCVLPRQAPHTQPVVARDLLFSPAWTSLPTYDVLRRVWPSSTAFESLGEVIDYRETIIDRHSWTDLQHDFYYRRFDAVRSGRSYR